jgi:hypothetical protein
LTERQNGHLSDATSRFSCIFVELSTEVGGGDSLDGFTAFVADDIDEIAALERLQ